MTAVASRRRAAAIVLCGALAGLVWAALAILIGGMSADADDGSRAADDRSSSTQQSQRPMPGPGSSDAGDQRSAQKDARERETRSPSTDAPQKVAPQKVTVQNVTVQKPAPQTASQSTHGLQNVGVQTAGPQKAGPQKAAVPKPVGSGGESSSQQPRENAAPAPKQAAASTQNIRALQMQTSEHTRAPQQPQPAPRPRSEPTAPWQQFASLSFASPQQAQHDRRRADTWRVEAGDLDQRGASAWASERHTGDRDERAARRDTADTQQTNEDSGARAAHTVQAATHPVAPAAVATERPPSTPAAPADERPLTPDGRSSLGTDVPSPSDPAAPASAAGSSAAATPVAARVVDAFELPDGNPVPAGSAADFAVPAPPVFGTDNPPD